MVISLGLERTILWDQIRYTGSPEDFVWVLPVPSPEVEIEVADNLFFAELEASTAPQIFPRTLPVCPSDGGAGGFQDAGAGGGVTVYDEKVVGPYQTVVLGGDDSEGLVEWLTGNGYAIPESTVPAIDHYVETGSVFIVLRLAPDQDVSAMQPIRVEFPGFMGSFPLKMVTVGAAGSLALTLWVIAEQRYTTPNYGSKPIDPEQVRWNGSQSNYRELFLKAVDDQGGKGWVTEFAGSANSFFFGSPQWSVINEDHPYPYLTRLATEIRVDHIAEDLELAPDADPSWVSNQFFPTVKGPSCGGSNGGNGGGYVSGCTSSGPAGGLGIVGLLLVAGLLLRRRL